MRPSLLSENGSGQIGWKTGCLALVLVALGLRLWGVNWAGDGSDPGALRVIDNIADGNLLYQIDPANPAWDQLFFFGAAMFKRLVWLAWSALASLTGLVSSIFLVQMPTPIIGRVFAALTGALAVYFVWRLARKIFRQPGTGFLAAALTCFSPLLVAQGHFVGRGSAAALAAAACLLFVVDIARGGGRTRYAAGGFCLGLACTVELGLCLLTPLFVAAHVMRVVLGKQYKARPLFGLPAIFLTGLAIGLSLGFPALLTGKVGLASMWSQLILPAEAAWSGPWVDGPTGGRLAVSLALIGDAIGWEIVALYLIGLGLCAARRNKAGMLTAAFPLYYWPLATFFLAGDLERLLPAMLPAMVAVASLTPVTAAEALSRHQPARAFGIVLLSIVLCLPAAWRSAGLGYLFWQTQPAQSAAQWLADNLPEGATLHHGPSAPQAPQAHNRPLDRLEADKSFAEGAYTVLSARDADRLFRPWTGRAYDQAAEQYRLIADNFQPIKTFDLKDMPPQAQRPGRRRFPEALSPSLWVYANLPARPIGQPLGLTPAPSLGRLPHNVCYRNAPAYSRDDTVIDLPDGGVATRTLRAARPLDALVVEAVNLDEKPAVVGLAQGPDNAQSQTLEPGQVWRALIPARNWPPTTPRVYPLKVSAQPGRHVVARIIDDPLTLGAQALEGRRWAEAEDYLTQAMARWPKAILPRALLAAVLLEADKRAEAAALLKGREQQMQMLSRLALHGAPLEQWAAMLGDWGGYHAALLLNAQTKSYDVEMHRGRRDGAVVSRQTEAFAAELRWPAGGAGPVTRVLLEEPFPAAPLLVRCQIIGAQGQLRGEGVAAQLKLVRRDGQKRQTVARLAITDEQLAQATPLEAALSAIPQSPADRWELVLESMRPWPLTIGQARVTVDPRQHLRQCARWAMLAWGQTLLEQNRLPMAIRALDDMALIDADFAPGLNSRARALIAGGRAAEAAQCLSKAQALLANEPKQLQIARELARKLGDDDLGRRLADRLTELTPPPQAKVRFKGGPTLIGYEIDQTPTNSGRSLRLRLYWLFARQPERDYHVSARLEGPTRIDLSHRFMGGLQRMDRVLPGQLLVDETSLELAHDMPEGLYSLVLSLDENVKGGRSLVVQDGNMAGRRFLTLPGVSLP
ncbi:hypothetical protein [Desulfarculus baarsii]